MSVAVTLSSSLVRYRRAFHLANKESNETVDEWYHRLQDLAVSCDYGSYLEMLLLDKIVAGLDEIILDHLCKEQNDLTLKEVIDFSRNYEMGNDHIDMVSRDALSEFCTSKLLGFSFTFRNQK